MSCEPRDFLCILTLTSACGGGEPSTPTNTTTDFDRAFVDGDDRLWVGSAVWPEQRSAPSEWSIFAPDGTWLGDVDAPPQLRIVDAREGRVLGIWQEEGEAPYVQVHRLLRP